MIDEKNVTITKTRHLGLKIFALVGAAAVLGTFVVLYALGLFTQVTGYSALDINADPINYRDGIQCYIYFNNNELEVRNEKSRAQNTFSSALLESHILTEPVETYEGRYNLATLNKSIGEDVTLEAPIYEILKDAYQHSSIDNNYSVFAGSIYDEWRTLINYHMSVADNDDIDPLFDGETDELLTQMSGYLFDESHLKLTFKENNVVRLDVSDAYKAFRAEKQIDSPIVSLNALRNAYEAKAVASAMEDAGFHNGYITSDRGYGVTLSVCEGLTHLVTTTIIDGQVATISFKGAHSFAKCPRFYVNGTYGYFDHYQIRKDGVTYYRSLYPNLTHGKCEDAILSPYLFKGDRDIVSMALFSERVSRVTTSAELNAFSENLRESGLNYAFVCKEDPSIIHIQASFKAALTVVQSSVVTVQDL